MSGRGYVCRCWSRGPFTSSPPGSPLPASSSCSSPTRCSRRCRRRSTPEVRLKPAGGAVPRQPMSIRRGQTPGRPRRETHTRQPHTQLPSQPRQVGMINLGWRTKGASKREESAKRQSGSERILQRQREKTGLWSTVKSRTALLYIPYRATALESRVWGPHTRAARPLHLS